MLYRLHLASAGFDLTALEEIDTDYIGSYKSKTVTVSLECPFLIAPSVFPKVCLTSQHEIKNVHTHSGAPEG